MATSAKRKAPSVATPEQINKFKPPNSIRLLLHLVDGAVPYLTPHMLEKCFPSSKAESMLLLGVAVRDTCVAPVYAPGSVKARGYEFSSSITTDAWLENYQRVTVPSFDLLQDAKLKQETAVTVSNQQVMIWTPHGRLPLTPDSYANSVVGLNSQIAVSLYDMVDSNQNEKRKQSAIRRTQEWFQHLVDHTNNNRNHSELGARESPIVWAPLLVDESGIVHGQTVGKATSVVAIGWQYVARSERRQDVLKQIVGTEKSQQVIALSTDSLEQVLDAVRCKCSVIGSSLPTDWARSKKAFVVDLHATNNTTKRPRCLPNQTVLDANGCVDLNPPPNNVKLHAWFADPNPMVADCACYTCTTHSRSYLYHLVCAKELLAEMLLFLHNLHHMLALVQRANEGDVHVLCDGILAQLGKDDDGPR
jgi:tRNA-guanine family transglycosylase